MSAADKQLAMQLNAENGPTSAWHDSLDAPGFEADAVTRSWLSEQGLLTQRLRENCGERFNMRVLSDQADPVAAGLRREVLLCCGDDVCVYAITDIPETTLAAHRWLAELGDEPLGEALQSRGSVTRSAFEYALIDARTLPIGRSDATMVAARRSEFLMGDDALSVTEVFLDALVRCTGNKESSNKSS